MNCSSVARIHRLGRSERNRPIILYFQNYREKQAVWKNVSKLKGSQISIDNDYSEDTRRKRKLLWESGKAEKAAGKKVFLVNDSLHVDNDIYNWNDTSNTRKWLSKAKKDPTKT